MHERTETTTQLQRCIWLADYCSGKHYYGSVLGHPATLHNIHTIHQHCGREQGAEAFELNQTVDLLSSSVWLMRWWPWGSAPPDILVVHQKVIRHKKSLLRLCWQLMNGRTFNTESFWNDDLMIERTECLPFRFLENQCTTAAANWSHLTAGFM